MTRKTPSLVVAIDRVERRLRGAFGNWLVAARKRLEKETVA